MLLVSSLFYHLRTYLASFLASDHAAREVTRTPTDKRAYADANNREPLQVSAWSPYPTVDIVWNAQYSESCAVQRKLRFIFNK